MPIVRIKRTPTGPRVSPITPGIRPGIRPGVRPGVPVRPGVRPGVPGVRPAPSPVAPTRPVVERPGEEFYSLLVRNANSYQPGILGKSRLDFFTLTPDPEKLYGNYGKAYIEIPANIQGIKFEFIPSSATEAQNAVASYRSLINTIADGVLTLYVNDIPVAHYRVDDISHSYEIDAYVVPAESPVLDANINLSSVQFTLMKDLIKAKVIKTKGIDRIYVSVQLPSALPSNENEIPADFGCKCTLLITPKREIIT